MGVFATALRIKQMLTPGAPAAGSVALYPKADNKWYSQDSAGQETLTGQEMPMLAPVRVCSGTNGVTLSGLQTVDGVALAAGDRVLVRWNGPATQNGIYVVAAGAWSRALDADTAAKIQRGMRVFALEGNSDRWKIFTQTQTLTTLGTDSVEWRLHLSVDFAGSLQYPGALGDGHLFWDRNAKSLAGWDAGWARLNGVRICTSTTRPIFTGDDAVIYETDTGNAYICSSGAWVPLGSVVVEDENASPVNVSKLDFAGAGVTVTNPNPGEALVTIAGGGAGTDEVSVGATAPASTLELWYDTATTAGSLQIDSGWVALTLQNSWATYSGRVPGYRKKNGVVYLRGTMSGGAAGSQPFLLPVGCRVGQFGSFACAVAGNYSGVINIDVSGTTQMWPGGGTIPSIDGVSFVADN